MAIKKQTGSVAYQFCDEAQAKASGICRSHHGPEMNYLFNNKLRKSKHYKRSSRFL